MKKLKSITAVGCALCIAAVGAFTGCSKDNSASEPVLPDVQTGGYVTFGSYEQDNDLSNGKEDIEWLVLAREDNKALLISKYALDVQPYSQHITEVPWENSFIRKWLNDTFLNEAFSLDEQDSIIMSTVTADENPLHKLSQGNDTEDKVFLLSAAEAYEYFETDSARVCEMTDYCYAQSPNLTRLPGWWLRSLNAAHVAAVIDPYKGSVQIGGDYVTVISPDIRPSIWIDLGLANLK
ncbi:DUF6273 domain-containing protein [uncultured Ruminococcus sp.]|uniref:DUF6273 domain-containing protein n=1 Tax=uncultured Ruminococcus sp. TaxID=165186 RepID=UPI0025D75736|nr:DUF6273 domain-containing protein [uncultured Ruminococcus sp.]